MKVFTCTKFTGHWPVGVAAVSVAENQEAAAEYLNLALLEIGLAGDAFPTDMVEAEMNPGATVLHDGDY